MQAFRRISLLLLLAVCVLSALAACRRAPGPVEGPQGTLGVAGFFQPQSSRELLAGYLPEEKVFVDNKTMVGLDTALVEVLRRDKVSSWMSAAAVRQCQEQVLAGDRGSRGSALDHWLAVGDCAGVDWLLVPQITYWRERDGSDVSVRDAASVTMDLFLIDVRGKNLGGRFHFEETELSLTENIFDADKFMRRGGKWITARDLAREGMARGLKEFGL